MAFFFPHADINSNEYDVSEISKAATVNLYLGISNSILNLAHS